MAIWEKSFVNLQKGHGRLMSFAAAFSDRVRAEINIVRLKIQIDGIRDKINEQHQIIGRKVLAMKQDNSLPRTLDLLLEMDEIASAVEAIERYQNDEEILLDDLQHEADVLKPTPARQEEGSA